MLFHPLELVDFGNLWKQPPKEYGLEVTDQVDERYHIEKATQAACDYFKKSKT